MNLVYSNKVTTNQNQFLEKVRYISDLLGIDPNWLMWVISFETAGTFSPTIQNGKTRATGLIQFMPDTAISLGTSVADLMQMSNVEQLDFVYQYLRPYKGRMNSMIDVYLAIFWPAAMNKPSDYILQTSKKSAQLVASQNTVFDLDKNSQITRGEIEARVSVGIPYEYQAIMKKKTVA